MTSTPQQDKTQLSVRISELAHQHHEELFPNHQSTLKVNDLELIEIFDNFAFDEVIALSQLSPKDRLMIIRRPLRSASAIHKIKIVTWAQCVP